ncbi:MAG: AI-2E family transporter [Rhodothermales bacterium]
MKNLNVIVVLLGVVAVFVLGVILQELRSVLLPFSVAMLLSIVFRPVVFFLKARRIPTVFSLLVVLLSLTLVLVLFGMLVFSSARSFTDALPRYQQRIEVVVDDAEDSLKQLAESLGIGEEDFKIGDLIQVSTVTAALSSGVGSFLSFLGNIFLVILFMLFILAGTGDLDSKVEVAFSPEVAERIATVVRNITAQVRQYLVTKTLISAATGFLIFLILWILGVDFPLLWGFLAFLLNYIPNIGSLLSVVLPFLLSLLQFDTLTRPILALVLMETVQIVMGNVIEPRMMAFSLNLSPLLVLVSLIFWGSLWGIVGMVLAVPLTATVKIFLENIEPLRPVAVLMGGEIKAKGG